MGESEIIGGDEFILWLPKRFTEVTWVSKKAKVLGMKFNEIFKIKNNLPRFRALVIERLKLMAKRLESLMGMEEDIIYQRKVRHIEKLVEDESKPQK